MPCVAAKIQQNFIRNCEKPLARGVNPLFYIGHLDDVEAIAFDSTNALIVTGLTMKTGKLLSVIEGVGYSNKPSVGFKKSDFGNTFSHSLDFLLFDNDPLTKKGLLALSGSIDLFVITKRNGFGADWEAYGLDTGMSVPDGGISQAADDEANKGAYVIKLSSDDPTRPPYTVRHKTGALLDTDVYLASLARPIV